MKPRHQRLSIPVEVERWSNAGWISDSDDWKRSFAVEYKHLGRSGVKVSRLCLGTLNFGPVNFGPAGFRRVTSEADSLVIIDKAVELGINFFDTANIYGREKGEGVTEQVIGRW